MISTRLASIKSTIPPGVELVAVSKFHPAEAIQEAYDAGQRIFGESRAQELSRKYEALPKDIRWHFIGHLQPNKAKYIAPSISPIHAVDSFKLLTEIDKQGRRNNRAIPCLLQLHVAKEETKFGFSTEECRQILDEGKWKELAGVEICGLMCMASNTDDETRIRSDFHTAHNFFKWAKEKHFAHSSHFVLRSWGMSDDYFIAAEEGSNMVRIGSAIFGEREV